MAYRTLRELILSLYPKRASTLINHKKKRIRKKYEHLAMLDNSFFNIDLKEQKTNEND